MTTSLVRNIPLVVETEPISLDHEDDSGFPFERADRDDSFRSQLDDIAKRHPELAEHFDEFPFRGERPRRSRPSADDFGSFPSGSSRFDRFPFSHDPFAAEPEFFPAPQAPPPPEQPPEPERPARKQPNIQPSNTVDLGQKQEPVNERSQRSMSAPPSDTRQRFTSSIHIPINAGMAENMGAQQSQSKPAERVIPIHVEGRDEPVLPKQPDRIFGQRPSQFTQFVNKEPPKQEKEPSPEPPPPPKLSNNPIDIIQLVQKDVSALMGQVEKFDGAPRDKQYLYLDEMLTRNLIKLDDIDTQGQENIRLARKEAIKCIQGCIGILEAKAAANVAHLKQPQEEEVKLEDAPEEKEEVVPETGKVEEEEKSAN